MATALLKQINNEIMNFESKDIQIVRGLPFNQHDTIEKVYFYYLSKFTSGEIDEEGDRKYFYNINKNPCKVFSKAIDFDTKNIRILTVGGGDPLKTWFMDRDLKFWMRNVQFGKILNRLFKELPIFGTVVLKIVDGYPYFVDLRNFVVEQSADDLDCSNYIIEIHKMTPAQFRNAAKTMKWEQSKVDETLKKFYEMKGISHIKIYERYGEVCEEDDKGNKSYPYKRVFHADVGVDEYDQYNNLTAQHMGVELSSVEIDEHPYWEFHADKLPGRWLGIGVVESLFEPQIAENAAQNLQSKIASYLSLLLFQSRSNVGRNLLTDTRSGEVVESDSEITQINISDRNLAFFNEFHARWLRNRDELTFSYDAIQGERSPAGTPLGSTQISVGQTLSYFEQIQEDVAMSVKEMIFDVIIPQFQKENSQEHTLRIVGQDLDQYIAMIKNKMVAEEVVRQAIDSLRGKPFPGNKERDVISITIEESIKQGKEVLLPIPKNFYQDVKYDVDIDITGESVDTRVRYATKFAILQAISADPTMTTDPVKRKFLFQMCEDGGVNPNELFDVERKNPEDVMPPMQRSGGGVSAPALDIPNLQGEAQATI